MRASRTLPASLAFGALLLASGCAQILGYQDIPDASPNPGFDATTDTGRHEAAVEDTAIPVKSGTKRCASSGVAFETYSADGGWSEPVACPSDRPVCIGDDCACIPGSTECAGQVFTTCVGASIEAGADAATPAWHAAASCDAGTCSLTGCAATPPSCQSEAGLLATCTPHASSRVTALESCCRSNEVPGGTFFLGYDAVRPYNIPEYRATVSAFKLDRFEVTVARFAAFVDAISTHGGVAGWLPQQGAGKHTHLNAGQGLQDRAAHDGGPLYEQGWQAAWDGRLTDLATNTQTLLDCDPSANRYTWGVTGADTSPINCVTWTEAYAFCIWDGGFLPSEAEWNFAAAGGSEQRYYPWSAQLDMNGGSPDLDAGCTNANFFGGPTPCSSPDLGPLAVDSPTYAGDSAWEQADLAGNVDEWTLDIYAGGPTGYAKVCQDCALLTEGSSSDSPDAGPTLRVQRGGSFLSVASGLRAASRGSDFSTDRSFTAGMRCARVP